jgi:hypothetical protein
VGGVAVGVGEGGVEDGGWVGGAIAVGGAEGGDGAEVAV